jgi:asparagine synthetase B (glutamine-hydrolysing)
MRCRPILESFAAVLCDFLIRPRPGDATPQADRRWSHSTRWHHLRGDTAAETSGAGPAPLAQDELGNVALVVGRPHGTKCDRPYWRDAHIVLRAYRERGASALMDGFNGAGAIVVADSRSGECWIVTDRLGFYPVYAAQNSAGRGAGECLAIGTNPDELASGAPTASGLDSVSLAEMLAAGFVSFPHTYFHGIQELSPGSIHRFASGRLAKHGTYWRLRIPASSGAEGRREAADALAEGLRTAIRRRTETAERPGLLLSGGLDARALLFAAHREGQRLVTATFADHPNRESRSAARLADEAGAEHHLLLRGPDHYGEHAADAVKLTAGMWAFPDAHAVGFGEALRHLGVDPVMTGYHFDNFFKGTALNTRRDPFMGRIFPDAVRLADFQFGWFRGHEPLANTELQEALEARWAEFYGEALELKDIREKAAATEERRVQAVSRDSSSGFRTSLRRMVPTDEVLADEAVLQVLSRLSPTDKLGGGLVRDVVSMLSRAAARLPDANTDLPVHAGRTRYVSAAAARKMKRVMPNLRIRPEVSAAYDHFVDGSWPDWSAYIRWSPALRERWHGISSETRQMISEITGRDPWRRSIPEWSEHRLLFAKILTLALWLDQRSP